MSVWTRFLGALRHVGRRRAAADWKIDDFREMGVLIDRFQGPGVELSFSSYRLKLLPETLSDAGGLSIAFTFANIWLFPMSTPRSVLYPRT